MVHRPCVPRGRALCSRDAGAAFETRPSEDGPAAESLARKGFDRACRSWLIRLSKWGQVGIVLSNFGISEVESVAKRSQGFRFQIGPLRRLCPGCADLPTPGGDTDERTVSRRDTVARRAQICARLNGAFGDRRKTLKMWQIISATSCRASTVIVTVRALLAHRPNPRLPHVQVRR